MSRSTTTPPPVFDEACIRGVAFKYRLRYIVLFGSEAGGYSGPHSDIDLAVKIGHDPTLAEMGLLHSELEGCASRRLDLVVLDQWDPIIAWEALSRGRLVYYCGPECLREYYLDLARALDEVADLEPLIELFRRETRRALSGASGQGK